MTVGRVEHWHDPAAPAPHSLVPACRVLAVNDAGEILLQLRRDTGQWALPMSKQEIGETVTECAVQETKSTSTPRRRRGPPGVRGHPAGSTRQRQAGAQRRGFMLRQINLWLTGNHPHID
jgi:hypothetical protein